MTTHYDRWNVFRAGVRSKNIPACFGIILLVVGGCGYQMVSQIGGNPQGIERIAIPLLQNITLKTGVELTATEALRDEFRLSPSWEIVPREEAQGILLGGVTRYEAAPTTFVEGQTSVLAFALVMEVELELQDRKGKTIWHGTFDGEERYDLADTLLRTEDNEQEAAKRLVQRLMKEARESIQLDF
ncbi:MAG: hypothetical protein HY538_06640 [Deltaproteobacteria bacterium]|nr:hypothetical protein [Deltaproteobacteria bacterium]